MTPQRVLVTGATGLIGSALIEATTAAGFEVRAAIRAGVFPGVEPVCVGEIGPDTDWAAALKGCNTVVHLAGATPSDQSNAADFQRVNVLGTRRLVNASLAANIERLVFVSSIFAVSDRSALPLDDKSAPAPVSVYGQSKLAAEIEVKRFADAGRVGISLRPPLVYDARAKGNFAALLRLAWSGLPLPFGSARNRRSLIGLDHLVDAIMAAVRFKGAESGAFGLEEGPPLSLADIIIALRKGMLIPSRLLPVSPPVLQTVLKAAGRGAMAQSLFGNLEVDATRFRDEYRWTPQHSTQFGLERTGGEFRAMMQARTK